MAGGPTLEIDGFSDLVEVGRGGFAVVYRARQERYNRVVALKVLEVTDLDDRSQQRFERECRAMGELSWHPNVVVLHESGTTDDGRPCLAMEFLERGSLGNRLNTRGPLPWPEVVGVGIQVAGALATAHHAGTLHRDLKPENLLIGPFGDVKLGDFGIAAVAGTSHTTTGKASMTLAHAAPEILEGKPATEQTDLYGLASTLYMLLAGRPAFRSDTDEAVAAIVLRVLQQPVPPLPADVVPADLDAFLATTMAKDPGQRPASAVDFGEGLQAIERAHGLPVTELRLGPGDGEVAATVEDQPSPPRRGDPRETVVVATPLPPVSASPGPDEPAAETPPALRRPSRKVLIGGAAVVAATILTAGSLIFLASKGRTRPEIIETISVETSPEFLLAGEDALFTVTSGSLARIDPGAAEITDEAALLQETIEDVAVGEGALWLGYSDRVDRVDPESLEVTDSIEAEGNSVAVGEGAVWAGSFADLRRIDPSTLEVTDEIGISEGGGLNAIAVDAGAVWALDLADGTVNRVDPQTFEVTDSVPVDAGALSLADLEAGEGAIWVLNGEQAKVSRIDPATLEVTDTTDVGAPGAQDMRIAVGEGAAWVTLSDEDGGGDVIRLDRGSAEPTDRLAFDEVPLTIAAGEGSVWVAKDPEGTENAIARIDPGSG